MIKTIKNHEKLKNIKVGDDPLSANIEYVKEVYGFTQEQLKKLTTKKLQKLKLKSEAENKLVLNPVSLFKYKGKTFGYYPLELGNLGSMIAFEAYCEKDKNNALAAILFREVSRINEEVQWKEAAGLEVCFIENFKKDFTSYKVKKIKDFERVDVSFFDELPYQIISSAINFTIGLGLGYKINIGVYLQPRLQIRQNLILALVNNLLFGMELQYRYQKCEKASQTFSDTAAPSPYLQSLSWLLSSGLYNEKKRLKRIKSELSVFESDDFFVDNFYRLAKKVYSDDKLNKTDLELISSVSHLIHKI